MTEPDYSRPFYYCGVCGPLRLADGGFAYPPLPADDVLRLAETHFRDERCRHRTDDDVVSRMKIDDGKLMFPYRGSYDGDLAFWGTLAGRHLVTVKAVPGRFGIPEGYRLRFRRNHRLVKAGIFRDDPRTFDDPDEAVKAARLIVEAVIEGPCPRAGHRRQLTEDRLTDFHSHDPWWRFGCGCAEPAAEEPGTAATASR